MPVTYLSENNDAISKNIVNILFHGDENIISVTF